MLTIAEIGNACVGCRSCEQSCPTNCITMQENREGFLYPKINETLCILCSKCVRSCPVSKPYNNYEKPLATYALIQKDEISLFDSASGGVSDVLAREVLHRGGYVYGAAYNDELVVHHIEIKNDHDRKRIQSSKYVQSDLTNTYSKVKQHLQDDHLVLYTGTPCQISGLYSFLGKDYSNLYTMDIICHGVPSPKFFRKYLKWQEEKMGERILQYNFRSKERRGWGTQYLLKIKTKTKTKTMTLAIDKYGKHFLAGDCYRECCYECRYANIHHPADLAVGDFWGIEQCHPELPTKLGVSSVIVETEKGEQLISWLQEKMQCIPVTIDDVLIKQGNLKKPTTRPLERDDFYSDIDSEDYISYIKVGLQVKERLKSLLPAKMIKLIKRFIR